VETFLQYLKSPEASAQTTQTTLRLSRTLQCPRTVVLPILLEVEYEASDETWGVRALGHAWHSFVNLFYPYQHLVELPVVYQQSNLKITGHVDIYDLENHIVIDIKTVSKNARRFLPKREHIAQVVAYALSKPDYSDTDYWDMTTYRQIYYKPRELALIYFFREDPHPDKTLVFTFKFPDDVQHVINSVQVFWRQIEEYLQSKTVPPIPAHYTPYTFPCLWRTEYGLEVKCPLFKYCWETEEMPQYAPSEDKQILVSLEAILREREVTRRAFEYLDRQYKALLEQVTTSLPDEVDSLEVGEYTLIKQIRRIVDNAWVMNYLQEAGIEPPRREVVSWVVKYKITNVRGETQ